MISDARNGEATFTGSGNGQGFINSQDDVVSKIPTAWPELQQGGVKADTDGDGMPDEWEDSHGLDKNNKADGNQTGEGGYTNLEIYLNSLVADITAAQNEGGELLGEKLPSETTGIRTVESLKFNGQCSMFNVQCSTYYDLQGRRVTTPSKGIYILNGRKVVI